MVFFYILANSQFLTGNMYTQTHIIWVISISQPSSKQTTSALLKNLKRKNVTTEEQMGREN